MAVWLVVKVLDVNYARQTAQTVQCSFGGGAPTTLQPTPNVAVYEIQIPAGTTNLSIRVAQNTFWEVTQSLTLNPGPPPTLSFAGSQEINVRNLDAHTRGSDFNVEVFVVLGQLRDAQTTVDSIAAASGISLSLNPIDTRRLGTPILNPSGTGWDKLNRTIAAAVTPQGRLFFVERTATPKLIAIYRPNRLATHPTTNPQNVPIDYHLFFHPFIPSGFSRTYPFHEHYVDLAARYLLFPTFPSLAGKQMVHQHEAAGQKAVFIFPLGSPVEQMGTLNTQLRTLRLLQEINYWIQRIDGVTFPLQPVGKFAMSCFSAGIRFLDAVLSGARTANFYDQVLKEVYIFDGVFAPNPRFRPEIHENKERRKMSAQKLSPDAKLQLSIVIF